VLPRARQHSGEDFLRLTLAWTSAATLSTHSLATSPTFVRFVSPRHPDPRLFPELRVRSTGEVWRAVRPAGVPQGISTTLTVQGTFDASGGTWYSCAIASALNASAATALAGVVHRGPYTQSQSADTLFCESPPIDVTEKDCTRFDTVDTWGRCYEALHLVVMRRWRREGEPQDREVVVAFRGVAGDSTIVITTPPPLLQEPQNGEYESNAPFFEGRSRSRTGGRTESGVPVEARGDYPSRHSVL